jgi:23S rRNA pseudouridine1911/1915/1917 synthase
MPEFQPPFPILFEDNHLLVVVKSPGIATMGVTADRPSVINELKEYIKKRYQKPGNVYLGVVSRLDTPVSGVLLVARTSKAAARLSEMFRTAAIEKSYWAVVSGRVSPAEGTWTDWIVADPVTHGVRCSARPTEGAKEARLSYRVLRHVGESTLVEVSLETGRKHQIRAQFARHGHPVLGDGKYGSRVDFTGGIALHARRLAFEHPVRHEPLDLQADPPATWRRYLA